MQVSNKSHFGPELFRFLADLKENNNRDWFLANKQRYDTVLRGPLQQFVGEFAPLLRKISTHYIADPRPVGGSLTRMNRDVRFSADKSPYKTMAGALFRHEKGRTLPAPAFLLHLEPGLSFAGIGVHSPDPQTLTAIRRRIASKPEEWMRAVSGKAFKAKCTLMAESLQRPPKGYAADHPCIDDLKRKHYCATAPFTDGEVCSADFLERFEATCRSAAGFMEYLTETLGLPW